MLSIDLQSLQLILYQVHVALSFTVSAHLLYVKTHSGGSRIVPATTLELVSPGAFYCEEFLRQYTC